MLTKIVLKKITSAIFLAIVLVVGTITLSGPSFIINAQATSDREKYYDHDDDKEKKSYIKDRDDESRNNDKDYNKDEEDKSHDKEARDYDENVYDKDEDKKSYHKDSYDTKYSSYKDDDRPEYKDKKYNSYGQDYKKDNSYGKDRDYDKSKDSKSISLKKLKCNNINVNVNNADLDFGGPVEDASTDDADGSAAVESLAAAQGGKALSANGERNFLDRENNFAFVCINNNNNIVVGQEEEPTITCEECFTDNLDDDQLTSLSIVLSRTPVKDLEGLCEALTDTTLTNQQKLLGLRTIFTGAEITDEDTIRDILKCLEDLGLLTVGSGGHHPRG